MSEGNAFLLCFPNAEWVGSHCGNAKDMLTDVLFHLFQLHGQMAMSCQNVRVKIRHPASACRDVVEKRGKCSVKLEIMIVASWEVGK